MEYQPIGHTIIWLPEVNSTNAYATQQAKRNRTHGMVIAAHKQLEGKGHGGNSWESQADMNLTFSIILHPSFLSPTNQFMLSKAVSLGLIDAIRPHVSGKLSIKWPNDIYINDGKVAGILIENSIYHNAIDSAIVGVGLNVNQVNFPDDIPNPTSLVKEWGRQLDNHELLNSLCDSINIRFKQLMNPDNPISGHYLQALYRKNDYHPYSSQGRKFYARIYDVKDSGELLLESENGEIFNFQFKEVVFEF